MGESNDAAEGEFIERAVNRLGDAAALLRSTIGEATSYSEAGEIFALAHTLVMIESNLMTYVNQQNDSVVDQGENDDFLAIPSNH